MAQLIDVANGFHLWSETYDSTEKDLLSLQSDVAKKVASALRIELHLAETTQLAKPPTQDPEAYDLYLRGRYLLNKRTPDSIQKGRALFEQAVAKDPRFALGHAGIADSYILLGKAWRNISRKRRPPEPGRRFQSRLESTRIWRRATFPARCSCRISIGTGRRPRPTSTRRSS